MPNICKEATQPDTGLLHPALLPYVQAIHVDKQCLFDAHDPVLVTLQVPREHAFQTSLKTPCTWTQLPLDLTDLEAAAEQVAHDSFP